MAHAVRDRQLQRIGDVIDAAASSAALPGRLDAPVLHALAALVPSDNVTFLDMEPDRATVYVDDEVADGEITVLAQPETDPDDPFWRHYCGAAHCSYPTRTGDDRSVTRRSDFYSTREWFQTPMYTDVLSEWHVMFEMMCPLPTVGGRSRRLLFFRNGGHDYAEEDRFALALLRPHLVDLMTRRTASTASTTLTDRQTELMQLVADGLTNAQIATALHLSPHTVRTHLANIFERLGVTSRAGAVSRLYSL